jgi:putative phosphoribosyl transferase
VQVTENQSRQVKLTTRNTSRIYRNHHGNKDLTIMFKNRTQAGILLSQKLKTALSGRERLDNAIVALPRGGVPIAVEIARAIAAPITVLVSKKIGAPFQPEYAIGAVSSTGVVVLNEDSGLPSGLVQAHIESERQRLTDETRQMELKWLKSAGLTEQLDFRTRRAIIVDDGIATGMTTLAAADSLNQLGALEVIIATPVLARQARELLAPHCHEIVALLEPADLSAIGLYYEDFHQVPDEEVRQALASCQTHR